MNMSFWGAKGTSRIKPIKPQIRVERVPVAKKPAPPNFKSSSIRPSSSVRVTSSSKKTHVATPPPTDGDSDSSRLKDRKRKLTTKKRSPDVQRVVSDSSDEDESGSEIVFEGFQSNGHKKRRTEEAIDLRRKLRSETAYDEGYVYEETPYIHAADITEPGKKLRESGEEVLTVELHYPSRSKKEKYLMIFEKDKIDPLEEVFTVAKTVADVYLTEEQRPSFIEPNTGLIRKLERARNMYTRDRKNIHLRQTFFDALDAYNTAIENLLSKGRLGKNLNNIHQLPRDMVQLILRQVYDRSVSPKVDLLKQYENGTDNVYGELLYPFISSILHKTNLKSDQIFVDLGSGVGNVVLQAALEIGCESWGCEMMDNACTLASAQEKEFAARCNLWGIKTGSVHLERGDFLENQRIQAAMRRADVIVVNNQAFTSHLNRRLIDLFLDVKDGCKIVSLKSFVPNDHKITSRNANDPVNVLEVKREEYGTGSVSWTNQGGYYFIARKDGRRLEEFARMAK